MAPRKMTKKTTLILVAQIMKRKFKAAHAMRKKPGRESAPLLHARQMKDLGRHSPKLALKAGVNTPSALLIPVVE